MVEAVSMRYIICLKQAMVIFTQSAPLIQTMVRYQANMEALMMVMYGLQKSTVRVIYYPSIVMEAAVMNGQRE